MKSMRWKTLGEGSKLRAILQANRRWAVESPLDPGPIAPLTPHDLVSLLKGAFALAILALLLLLASTLLHIVP